ncbi:hypothetical protein C1646_762433, partial [Rhizophagus diaphanus]
MQACSPALKIFKRANGGYMLRDTSRPLEVLSIHAELQTNRNYCFNPYYHAITKKENIPTPPWVPLLPGHCVIGKFGSLYEANSNFFVSMRKYIKQSGEISISDILGLRNPSIIHDLQSKVNSIYPNLFNTNAINPQNKINKLTTVMQKKEKKLLEKASAISHSPIIYHGIEIKEPGMRLSPEATLALTVEYEVLKKSEDSSCKWIKRVKTNNEYIKNLKYKLHEEKDQELLNNWIRKTLEETNIGSIIFVNTEQTSYNLQVKIKCKICQGITEYSNESPNAQFSSLAAGTGLVGGVNRQQLQTIFSIIGITAQSSKGHYH